MNNLTVVNRNGQLVVDSREVARMVGKEHKHLLRDVKGYTEILNQSNFGLVEFFIPYTYKDSKGEDRPCYLITRKGCDMVANKMTGEKGVLFTAAYVTKFEEMEKTLKGNGKQALNPEAKKKEIEARYNNSLARKANILLKIASSPGINPRYRQVLQSQASAIIAGKPLLPLPEVERTTLTAKEVGDRLGISANMVGRLAGKHNLKTDRYGKMFHDKSPYSAKEVESFRYYENVIPELERVLGL